MCFFKKIHMRQKGSKGGPFPLRHSLHTSPWNTANAVHMHHYSLVYIFFLIPLSSSQNVSELENNRHARGKSSERRTTALKLMGIVLSALLFTQSSSHPLHQSPIMALGGWAFYLSTASSHLPWKSRLFPPYASMFCQASLVGSALSKFHYEMAGSTMGCSLRLSAWHVTGCSTVDAGGWIAPV